MCTSASLVFSFACPRMSDVEHFVFHVLVVFWSDSFPQSHNGKPFAVIHGSIFPISLSDSLVCVGWNAPAFCMWTSYSAPSWSYLLAQQCLCVWNLWVFCLEDAFITFIFDCSIWVFTVVFPIVYVTKGLSTLLIFFGGPTLSWFRWFSLLFFYYLFG